jgi:hypothetical protein
MDNKASHPTFQQSLASVSMETVSRNHARFQDSALGCNVETNVEPAIKFYEDCVGSDATRTMIANIPSLLLCCSLEKRLKPRLAERQKAGIPIDAGTLQRTAMMTTEKWSSSMAFQKTKLFKEQPLDRFKNTLPHLPAVLGMSLDGNSELQLHQIP